MTFALLQVVEHETPLLLDPKAGLFFFTLLVFLIVAFLLRKFAWGPITEALATREKTIEDSIHRAEKALAEARQISEDNEIRVSWVRIPPPPLMPRRLYRQ